MAWRDVRPTGKGAAMVPDAGVTLSMRRVPGGRSIVRLEIGNEIARQMAWDDGSRIDVAVGDEAQQGLLRLVAGNTVNLASAKRSGVLFAALVPWLPDRASVAKGRTPAAVKIVDFSGASAKGKAVLVTLPAAYCAPPPTLTAPASSRDA